MSNILYYAPNAGFAQIAAGDSVRFVNRNGAARRVQRQVCANTAQGQRSCKSGTCDQRIRRNVNTSAAAGRGIYRDQNPAGIIRVHHHIVMAEISRGGHLCERAG